jgi:hypothetical protein
VRKIVGIDLLGFLTPNLPAVAEVADQLFLLGVDTDHGLVGVLVLGALRLNVDELLITIRMLLPGILLAVGAQAVAVRTQDTADDWFADLMTVVIQSLPNIAQATIEPLLAAHWVARRIYCHQRQNQRFEFRVFFSAGGRPAPLRRWRVAGVLGRPASNSRRPRRIVLRSSPVMSASWRSPGLLGSWDRKPTYQRRCGSVSRLNNTLI